MAILSIPLNILAASWQVLLEAAPFVLFGFFVAGLLKAFLPEDLISRHLGRGTIGPIVKAALVGAPLPLCSCGVLPAAADLRKRGAGKGATAAFLTATPETGVDSVAVTYGLLDPAMTVIRPLAAVASAIAAGLAVSLATKNEQEAAPAPEPPVFAPTAPPDAGDGSGGQARACACSGCCAPVPARPVGVAAKLAMGLDYAVGELMRDVGLWLMVGVLLAGAVGALVPAGLIERHLGTGLPAMLAALALSTPLYICATASTPLAAALAAKGLSPGAALVLLLAGPATNAAALAVAAKILGRRGLAAYLAAVVLASLGLGLATDALYLRLGLSTAHWATGGAEGSAGIVSLVSAVILPALVVRAMAWPRLKRLLA